MRIKRGMRLEYQKYVRINSKDAYSKAVATYGERWAELMEAQLAAGKTIADCADSTSHEADTEGITGFMHGCAVKALSRFWGHGEALRIWHNLDTQLQDEGVKANEKPGAVLNPAILVVETKN